MGFIQNEWNLHRKDSKERIEAFGEMIAERDCFMADEGAGGPPTSGPPNVQVCVSDTTNNHLSTKLPLNSVKYEF